MYDVTSNMSDPRQSRHYTYIQQQATGVASALVAAAVHCGRGKRCFCASSGRAHCPSARLRRLHCLPPYRRPGGLYSQYMLTLDRLVARTFHKLDSVRAVLVVLLVMEVCAHDTEPLAGCGMCILHCMHAGPAAGSSQPT